MEMAKEHDLINFSMKADVGARRYYNKEVLYKDGNLIVNLDGNDIPLGNIYHIEVVGTSRIKIEPPTEEKGMSEREKIIKALKCCTHDGCDKCPFRKYKCTCQIDLAASALAEIEQLTERLSYFQKSSDYHEGNQKELETKNAELQKEIKHLTEELANERNAVITFQESANAHRLKVGEVIKQNAELQKQVDELTKHLNRAIILLKEDSDLWFKYKFGVEVE